MMFTTNETTEIVPFRVKDVKPAAAVVARAMLHNPMHLAIFGAADRNSELMQTRMFVEVLKMASCNVFAALLGGQVVGVMNYYRQGCCQISPLQTLGMLPKMTAILGPKLFRVLKWKKIWSRYDHKIPHLHLGPLAVLPELQWMGIGSDLLTHFCVIADMQEADAYLETDKKENIRLYEKFGFDVVAEADIFGVKNWFLWRASPRKTGKEER